MPIKEKVRMRAVMGFKGLVVGGEMREIKNYKLLIKNWGLRKLALFLLAHRQTEYGSLHRRDLQIV